MSDAPSAQYSPGTWVAIAVDHAWMLAAAEPSSPSILSWWEAMRGDAPIDRTLGLIATEGFRVIESFALAEQAPDGGVTVVLRGRAHVVWSNAGEERELQADGVSTWRHESIDGPIDWMVLESLDSAAGGAMLPLGLGVAMADRVLIGSPSVEPTQVLRPCSDGQHEAEVSANAPSPQVDLVVDADPEVWEPATPGPIARGLGDDAVTTFDHLFGATEDFREASDLSVPPAEDPPVVEASADPSVAFDRLPSAPSDQVVDRGGPTSADTMPPEAPAAGVESPSSDLINALPWQAGVSANSPVELGYAAPPGTSEADDAPVTDETIDRSRLLEAARVDSALGPTVRAIQCSRGHLSPAHAEVCRVCGFGLGAQDAITAPRPTLGVLALSTGDRVLLDRSIVLGRAPEVADHDAASRPHVVMVLSPENDISRTHLEVRLDGWHVLVVDLDSTNGTVVTQPGQPPQRLRAHDPVAIEPGTTVCLADEVTFAYEVGE